MHWKMQESRAPSLQGPPSSQARPGSRQVPCQVNRPVRRLQAWFTLNGIINPPKVASAEGSCNSCSMHFRTTFCLQHRSTQAFCNTAIVVMRASTPGPIPLKKPLGSYMTKLDAFPCRAVGMCILVDVSRTGHCCCQHETANFQCNRQSSPS